MNLAQLRHSILTTFQVQGKALGWEVELKDYNGSFQIAHLVLKREGLEFNQYVYARQLVTNGIMEKGKYSYDKLVSYVQLQYRLWNDCFRIRKEKM